MGNFFGYAFFKEDIQMANKHMKRCPTALVIMEMQVKTTMRYHYTCTKMSIIKKLNNSKCWLECGELELSYTVGGNIKCYNCFLFKIFLMWTIFKVFIEFVTILLLFYVLVFWPRGMWGLTSLTRDQTHTPFIGRQSLNHWTTREVPVITAFENSSPRG